MPRWTLFRRQDKSLKGIAMFELIDTVPLTGLVPSAIVGIAAYSFVTSITPGPNNILLAASGARFGLARTLPHMLGVWFGMITLLLAATAGVGVMIADTPALGLAMKVVAAAALIYTALAIARSKTEDPDGDSADAGQPWGFLRALGFQYVNPKAVVMAVTAVSAFASPGPLLSLQTATIVAIFMIVGIPCTGIWALAGVSMRRALKSSRRRRAFNWAMAALLLATVPLTVGPARALA